MTDRLEHLEALLAAATPGPWERGDVWAWAGVQSGRTGPCALCDRMGAPVWTGQANINGTVMLAHKHRDPDPYGADHIISAEDGQVLDDRFVRAEDAALIAAVRNALPDLVAVVKAARDADDSLSYLPDYPHQPDCGAWNVFCATCYGLIVRDELHDSLASLRAES